MTDPTPDTPDHGCTIDGQPAMPVLVSEHQLLVARAAEAEARLRRIAGGGPRADAVQAEIGEMIAQTHELRDQLRNAEAALVRVRKLAEFARDRAAPGRDDHQIGQHDLACAVLDVLGGPTAEAEDAALEKPGSEFKENGEHLKTGAEPAATQATGHVYLSTGCYHDDHAYCQNMTGLNGAKRPAECKKCRAKCICRCHTEPGPAAAEAEKTTRVFAALHRSAEQDVSRVIGLYERWVKAGPPPLGTLMSRWWDARLVELYNAILPPAGQPKEQ